MRKLLYAVVAACALAGPSAAAQTAGPAARLTFVKDFLGSRPAYMKVVVGEDGHCAYYGDADAESEPQPFQLSSATVQRLFALAGQLNYFRDLELESPRPVANMGRKTFQYEKGSQRWAVNFNYTENETAVALLTLFEKVARGQYLGAQLDYQSQYDRLGLPSTIREFEREFNSGGFVDLEQFAPVLERIVSDRRVARLVQAKAEALLRRIRGAPARVELEYGDQYSGLYYRASVDAAGTAVFERRGFTDRPNPRTLVVPQAAIARVLELVRLGNYFRGLAGFQETGTALVGYRLLYESGAEHNEVAFISPPDAITGEIVHIFRQALRQEDFRQRLREAKAEGETAVLVLLQELETAARKGELIDPKEFEKPVAELTENGSDEVLRAQAARVLAYLKSLP